MLPAIIHRIYMYFTTRLPPQKRRLSKAKYKFLFLISEPPINGRFISTNRDVKTENQTLFPNLGRNSLVSHMTTFSTMCINLFRSIDLIINNPTVLAANIRLKNTH